ncbi:MAG: flagellar biosynthesis anti-sigma factor FlgM [Sphingomonadales bacterium]|nr:flagellar biosynthesis anti-sigma factor FlgM [Sphingomonadales bacterium]
MVTTNAFSAGQAPVDGERVSQIRKAIQSGSYPMIPAKISDAMIAAGIMLQVER